MAENKGKPLPKFGEWDVNNPASAEGFTVIFSKASDEKKTKKASGAGPNSLVSPQRNQNSDQNNNHSSQNPKAKNKWFCFR
ncbi:unnamed protein product [Arabidopsis thaliana]|uniref:RPM1-interacting protein 4 (RIN4) family protein n=4 Tax=Arabidopsis TaxID=3701 RepID=Q9FMJ6_ARATH|nr:RPM1-interacting protein 4 (RIN4) family protein [Arabidopsis thaliana]KAG7614032.1 RIN4 pathogenic type III effector avirulence factor Avr cleavage site [Arabidopsis suecica]AED97726.1 RPM1-interacting protein 4 (RIN4) family protein [Arabidopsis thaliana]OAO93941.1 hypothetical protein AXX17_AT5G62850 [Arabidopsis thaliana]CAA0411702.1 unnamed protein product [Arabidopsis thaliana]CAD5335708.1 unnamed protein product [Arabidopsis thaliana]|eukprot:NP_201132.1 RPM1-interacting protein 4 (RIN4) family protein [Arabidopsis thaliana]